MNWKSSHVVLRSNSARRGGAIAWLPRSVPQCGLVQIRDCQFVNNHATVSGGAVDMTLDSLTSTTATSDTRSSYVACSICTPTSGCAFLGNSAGLVGDTAYTTIPAALAVSKPATQVAAAAAAAGRRLASSDTHEVESGGALGSIPLVLASLDAFGHASPLPVGGSVRGVSADPAQGTAVLWSRRSNCCLRPVISCVLWCGATLALPGTVSSSVVGALQAFGRRGQAGFLGIGVVVRRRMWL